MDVIVRLNTRFVRTLLITLVVATSVTVAGCSSGPVTDAAAEQAVVVSPPVTRSPVPPVTRSPAQRVTPSPAPLTDKQAALRYVAIVRPYNVALERLEKAVNGGRPVATLRTLAAKVAEANRTQIRRLGNTPWPAVVRAPVRDLRAESLKAQRYWLLAARAQTSAVLIQEVLKASRHDGAKAAGRIRRLLDLEEYDENDYS